ncbi:phage head closure protein [Ligilactobacillus cholophilus]|uniref:phage head closure protein n=1 Tax=Ligilactobacillus cholophilus TaxID=3050131 RepID=UPI0025AF1371|nr:phage head closure protein [Ligilactobacillus cholophilus]
MQSQIKSRFKPYQFNGNVTFSTIIQSQNQHTHIMQEIKKEVFTKKFARVKNTLSQKYSVVGTQYEKSFNIAIRHTKQLEEYDYLIATINGIDYNIIDMSLDNENYNSYDLLTLVKKEGNSNG